MPPVKVAAGGLVVAVTVPFEGFGMLALGLLDVDVLSEDDAELEGLDELEVTAVDAAGGMTVKLDLAPKCARESLFLQQPVLVQ